MNKAATLEEMKALVERSWLNVRMVEAFVTIVQEESITRAAARLGMTQSAVSQCLAAIESSLGAKLLDRSSRPMQLTVFGVAFHHKAVDLLRRARELEQMVKTRNGEQLPLLRLAMDSTFASTAGPALLKEVRPLAASWSVASGVLTSLKALRQQQMDVAITAEEVPPAADLVMLPILREPYFIVAPKSMAVGRRPTIKSLGERLPFIRYSPVTFLGRRVESYLAEKNEVLPNEYELDTTEAVLAVVREGMGWTISTPMCVIKSRPAMDDFQCLPLKDPPFFRTLKVIARRDHHVQLWDQIASASTAILQASWLPAIRKLAPWSI